jgi:hypothetical protein
VAVEATETFVQEGRTLALEKFNYGLEEKLAANAGDCAVGER